MSIAMLLLFNPTACGMWLITWLFGFALTLLCQRLQLAARMASCLTDIESCVMHTLPWYAGKCICRTCVSLPVVSRICRMLAVLGSLRQKLCFATLKCQSVVVQDRVPSPTVGACISPCTCLSADVDKRSPILCSSVVNVCYTGKARA